MTRIHFIGTRHYDLLGPGRLEKALGTESPSVITVEASRVHLDYLEAEGLPLIHKRIDSLGFSQVDTEFLKRRFGEIGFEVEISRLYALQHNIPLHYVDLRDVEKTKKIVQIVCNSSREKFECEISHFVPKTEIADSDRVYSLYENLFAGSFEKEQKHTNFNAIYLEPHRDSFMADRIERIAEIDGRITHIGGIMHCLNDVQGRTLFSKLRGYNPTRQTLKWYEDR